MPQISDADRKLLADILGRIQDDAPPDQPPTDPPVIVVPSKVPARVLDLVPWKLTLDLPGAPEIKPKALQDYTDDGFLVTLDGWVRMRAYCGGGHTTGSKYPRKEFRECNRDGTNASWSTTSGAHHLTVVHRITHLPVVKPEIVVAQIHDAADDVVMVRYEKGRLFVEAAGNEIALLDPDLPLGQTFTTGIDSSKGYIDVSYNGVLKMHKPFKKTGCYFKAGVYVQSNTDRGDAPDAYGEVELFNLLVSHAA